MPASTSTLTCSLSNLRSGSNGNLSPQVEQNINHMKLDCMGHTQDIVSEFANKGLFTGVGCIKDFQYKIVVDESVTLSSWPACHLPPVLCNIVEAKLRQMLNDKIITKVMETRGLSFKYHPLRMLANKINGAEIYTMLDAASAFH